MAVEEEEKVLPHYFPLAPKPCAARANTFFDCFTAAGAQAPDTADADAGRRGVAECARQLAAYEKVRIRALSLPAVTKPVREPSARAVHDVVQQQISRTGALSGADRAAFGGGGARGGMATRFFVGTRGLSRSTTKGGAIIWPATTALSHRFRTALSFSQNSRKVP